MIEVEGMGLKSSLFYVVDFLVYNFNAHNRCTIGFPFLFIKG